MALFVVYSCNEADNRKGESDTDSLSVNELKSDNREFSEKVENVKTVEGSRDSTATLVIVNVKNPELYSVNFINEIKSLREFKEINLSDSFIILNHKDTVIFPDVPVVGKRITLTGYKNNLSIAVHIRRVNYTTVKYKIEMNDNVNGNYEEEGYADLSAGFILAEEIDENDFSGMSCSSYEYSDNKGGCYLSLRLGYEVEKQNLLLGKLIKNCNGKIRNIELGDFPTLVEK
jgi:hypothetical protein